MNGERTEIRYSSPRLGYATEIFQDASTMAAINLIKARVGNDVTIIGVRYLPAPSPFDRPREGGR